MNISDSVSTAISNQSEQLLKYKVNGEQKMEDSKKQMAQMREAMDKIQESSKQVVGVIKAIKDISICCPKALSNSPCRSEIVRHNSAMLCLQLKVI